MWARIINIALGIGLMAMPGVFGYGDTLADQHHIFGPIAASIALIAAFEATAGLARANVPAGLWIVAAAVLFRQDAPLLALLLSAAAGVAIAGLGLVTIDTPDLGGGWRSLPRLWREGRNATD